MTRLLIVESETPDVVDEAGNSLAIALGETLRSLDPAVEIEFADPYLKPLDLHRLDVVNAAIFPGSRVPWSAGDADAAPLRQTMERVFEVGLPCFGSCNGLQLAGVVLGGRVEAAAEPEVGVAREVHLTDEGTSHPMMAGRSQIFAVPAVHRDRVVELPPGARCLAGNWHSLHQAFVYEADGIDFWGAQYHTEIAAEDIAMYLRSRPDLFGDYQHLIADLLAAETDENAAARLGARSSELRAPARTTELRNWLAHVAARRAPGRMVG